MTKANPKAAAKLMIEHHGSYEAATDNNQRAIDIAGQSGDEKAIEILNEVQVALDVLNFK